MLIAMTAVVVVGDQHRAAFATYSAVSVLPVSGTRVSSLSSSRCRSGEFRSFHSGDLLR